MTTKVINPINICYLESKHIHKMHSGIKHIVESFQEVHTAYKDLKEDNIKMYTPLDHLKIIRINGPRIRNNGTKMAIPTPENAPYLFNTKGRCELKLKDLTTPESLTENKPIMKNLQNIHKGVIRIRELRTGKQTYVPKSKKIIQSWYREFKSGSQKWDKRTDRCNTRSKKKEAPDTKT